MPVATGGGLHLWLGPDRPRKLQRLHDLERTLRIQPLDRHQIDGTAATPQDLLALCRQQPAVSPLRLIVIDAADRLTAACVAALADQAGVIARSACVICLAESELSVRHALTKMGKAATTERFPGRAAKPMKPFVLTDALGKQDPAGALASLRDQLDLGKDPLELLGLIAWQLQRWMTVKRLGQAGYSTERIVAVTGFHSWQVQRLQSEVSRRSLESLQQILARCWQLDVDVKRGRTMPELALEQLVVEICLLGGSPAPVELAHEA